ncbi:MAG: ABC transporter ATP-binding protein/permease [Candidatus Krumholzibacteria bacterium]|nr:ABC transporter ATP-binding protein/permease [Candidatus Krumholzibacteria bacterium]
MSAPSSSKEKRRAAIRTVFSYLGRYRARLAVGGASLVLTDIFAIATPWILKTAIDALSAGITRERLFGYAGLLVGITACAGVFRFLMRRIMIGVSRRIEIDMRADFFAHLQNMSPAFYHRHRTGDLMALATNDLNAVRTLVGPAVMYSMNTFVIASLAIALMSVLSWKLMIAALLPMALLTFGVYHSIKIIHRLFERVQEKFASINARAQENLSGIRVVKAYAREDYETAEFAAASSDYVDANWKLFKVQSLLHPLLATVAGFGVLAILLFGGRMVIRGEITLGTFVAFNGYLSMLVFPVIAAGWVMNMTEQGLASMQRINDVMAETADITDASACADAMPADASVRFENVSFSYSRNGDRGDVVCNVNFEVKDGETVAVVGATGSGKTTIISLLMRLYDPTQGRVLVGGCDVREIPLQTLRGMIGLVPQDIFLFSQTIRENISFGVSELPDPVLQEVSRTAAIYDEVEAFPHKFESMIGERGINLSGGQKQRVAIARALAKQPRILILDDALSSVDATTEENILSSLEGELEKRTAILISHRVSTARQADRVMVMRDGEIAESGTHEQLIAHGGIYAEMYRKQMLMVALEQE